jgi:hypothetical protein
MGGGGARGGAGSPVKTRLGRAKVVPYGPSGAPPLRGDGASPAPFPHPHTRPSCQVLNCPYKNKPEENKEKAHLHYTSTVDSWAVGVLAYELLVGCPPFYEQSRDKIEARIRGASPNFPRTMSDDARAFIAGALSKDPAGRPTVLQLLQHPWVNTFRVRRSMRQLPSGGPASGAATGAGDKAGAPHAVPAPPAGPGSSRAAAAAAHAAAMASAAAARAEAMRAKAAAAAAAVTAARERAAAAAAAAPQRTAPVASPRAPGHHASAAATASAAAAAATMRKKVALLVPEGGAAAPTSASPAASPRRGAAAAAGAAARPKFGAAALAAAAPAHTSPAAAAAHSLAAIEACISGSSRPLKLSSSLAAKRGPAAARKEPAKPAPAPPAPEPEPEAAAAPSEADAASEAAAPSEAKMASAKSSPLLYAGDLRELSLHGVGAALPPGHGAGPATGAAARRKWLEAIKLWPAGGGGKPRA